MPMSDGRVGKLPDVLREAVAVLAAILIAFGLDAWWNESVERREMLRALDAVVIELDENIALADSILEVNAAGLRGVDRLADLAPGEALELPMEELARLSRWLDMELLNPRVGAITAFIDGGFLAIVEDVGLRTTVAGIPSILDEVSEESVMLLDLGASQAVATAAALGPAEFVDRLFPGAQGQTLDSVTLAVGFDRLVRDDAFMALMAGKSFFGVVYRRELGEMMERLAATRDQIQAALAETR